MEQESMRLHKYMALCGVASRRAAELMIRGGRVTVDGTVMREMGSSVTGVERIELDGEVILPESQTVYILLHKPEGYVSTASDPQGRPTVLSLLNGVEERVYPVGRLDWDSSGLLLLTNDGDMTHRLTHPRHEISKCYIALVEGVPSGHTLNALRRGIYLDGKKTAPAQAFCVPLHDGSAELELTIREGRNRQVRRMCEEVGHPVRALKRIAIGGLYLGELAEGEWRYATPEDLSKMTGES